MRLMQIERVKRKPYVGGIIVPDDIKHRLLKSFEMAKKADLVEACQLLGICCQGVKHIFSRALVDESEILIQRLQFDLFEELCTVLKRRPIGPNEWRGALTWRLRQERCKVMFPVLLRDPMSRVACALTRKVSADGARISAFCFEVNMPKLISTARIERLEAGQQIIIAASCLRGGSALIFPKNFLGMPSHGVDSLDITHFARSNQTLSFIIEARTVGKIKLQIVLIEKCDPASYVGNLYDEIKIPTPETIKKHFSGLHGDDLSMEGTRISLLCPLSKLKIKIPSITRHCGHLQFFDFDSVVNAYPGGDYVCPLCQAKFGLGDVRILEFFETVLNASHSGGDSVLIDSQGNWTIESEQMQHGSPDTEGSPAGNVIDITVDGIVERYRLAYGRNDDRNNVIVID